MGIIDLLLRHQGGDVNHIDIRDAMVALQSTSKDDCAMVLIKHNLLLIKRHCKYHIISDYLQPAVYRIGENKLLLNNISSLIVSRVERKLDSRNDANDTVVEIQNVVDISVAQFIFQLPCEAMVTVLNKIYYSSEHCNFFQYGS